MNYHWSDICRMEEKLSYQVDEGKPWDEDDVLQLLSLIRAAKRGTERPFHERDEYATDNPSELRMFIFELRKENLELKARHEQNKRVDDERLREALFNAICENTDPAEAKKAYELVRGKL